MESSIGSFPISHVKIETMLRYCFFISSFFAVFSIYIIFLYWYVIRLLLCVLLSWILKRKQFLWLHEKFKPIPKVKFFTICIMWNLMLKICCLKAIKSISFYAN